MVGGYLWCIYYYPNGDSPENAKFISLQLGLLHEDVALAKTFKLLITFSILDQIHRHQESMPVREVLEFPVSGARAVVRPFVNREALEKSKYLKDDSFTIRCDIVAVVEDVGSVDTAGTTSSPTIVVPPSDMPQQLSNLLLSQLSRRNGCDVQGPRREHHSPPVCARSKICRLQGDALWQHERGRGHHRCRRHGRASF
jgi:speckle-type POZ protein